MANPHREWFILINRPEFVTQVIRFSLGQLLKIVLQNVDYLTNPTIEHRVIIVLGHLHFHKVTPLIGLIRWLWDVLHGILCVSLQADNDSGVNQCRLIRHNLFIFLQSLNFGLIIRLDLL